MKKILVLLAILAIASSAMAVNTAQVTLTIMPYKTVDWAGDFVFGNLNGGSGSSTVTQTWSAATNVVLGSTVTSAENLPLLVPGLTWGFVPVNQVVFPPGIGPVNYALTVNWTLLTPPAAYGGNIVLTIL